MIPINISESHCIGQDLCLKQNPYNEVPSLMNVQRSLFIQLYKIQKCITSFNLHMNDYSFFH